MVQLQAHRGVCTEYPENTMQAFSGAIRQGYPIIELDPAYTSDGVLVVLHDSTINRTGRKMDGSVISDPVSISQITYEEADSYEYGSWFSSKFKGARIPLLKDALKLAYENDVLVKIDNKIWGFPEEHLESLWMTLRDSKAKLAITCNSVEVAKISLMKIPEAEIHYDGPVCFESLEALRQLTDKLTVWLPYECSLTKWAKVDFVSEELCALVKRYAKLGVWIIANQKDYEDVCKRFAPNIVETTGHIKPELNVGIMVDTHTHSEHSHDCVCPIRDMAAAQKEKGMYAFAVTDHCDSFRYKPGDTVTNIRDSVADVKSRTDLGIKVLSGVELGEGILEPQVAKAVLQMCDYDIVIASVHVIKFREYDTGFMQIDFTKLTEEDIYDFLELYYDSLLQTVQEIPCDVAAHLNVPLRYINGKHGRNISISRFENKIEHILRFIIEHGIALEINTSCIMPDGRDLLEQENLLQKYVELGGFLVTIGSDAHTPARAGAGFEWAIQLLAKCGLKYYFYYEKRQSIQCTIRRAFLDKIH